MLEALAIAAIGKDASRACGHTIIVRDEHGNTLVVCQQLSNGMIGITHLNEGEKFQRALDVLGISRVTVNSLEVTVPPPAGAKLITDLAQLRT